MKKTLITLSALFPVIVTAAVPHTFEPNTPAKASEVNANFTDIDGKTKTNSDAIAANVEALATLDAKLAEMEAAAKDQAPLEQVEMEFEVDCTNDGAALLTKYQEFAHVSNINFAITGECYGDIRHIPVSKDENGEDVHKWMQFAGQSLHIYAKTPETRAKIIANPETGNVRMDSGLSGGLYLANIDIIAGSNESNPIGYYRNGHGDLNNVTVTGANWTAILIQEGAQAYLQNVTVNNSSTGLFARHNAVVRLFGDNHFNATNYGVELYAASSVHQQGSVSVQGPGGHGARISNSVWFMNGDEHGLTINDTMYIENGASVEVGSITNNGNLHIIKGSTLQVRNSIDVTGNIEIFDNSALTGNDLTTTQMINISASVLNFTNSVNFNIQGEANWDNKSLEASDGSSVILTHVNAGWISAFGGSSIKVNHWDDMQSANTIVTAEITGSSFVETHNTVTNNLYMHENSTAILRTSELTSSAWIHDSYVKFEGSTLSLATVNLENSVGHAGDGQASKFQCKGLSSIAVANWQKVNNSNVVDTSTNCVDTSVWDDVLTGQLNSYSAQ